MNEQQRTGFLKATAQALDLMRQAHAALQAAQSQCHGVLYDHVAPMGKRIYELRITAEWLEQVALGRLSLEGPAQPQARQTPDRRQALDRRIAGMRKELTTLKAGRSAPQPSQHNALSRALALGVSIPRGARTE